MQLNRRAVKTYLWWKTFRRIKFKNRELKMSFCQFPLEKIVVWKSLLSKTQYRKWALYCQVKKKLFEEIFKNNNWWRCPSHWKLEYTHFAKLDEAKSCLKKVDVRLLLRETDIVFWVGKNPGDSLYIKPYRYGFSYVLWFIPRTMTIWCSFCYSKLGNLKFSEFAEDTLLWRDNKKPS